MTPEISSSSTFLKSSSTFLGSSSTFLGSSSTFFPPVPPLFWGVPPLFFPLDEVGGVDKRLLQSLPPVPPLFWGRSSTFFFLGRGWGSWQKIIINLGFFLETFLHFLSQVLPTFFFWSKAKLSALFFFFSQMQNVPPLFFLWTKGKTEIWLTKFGTNPITDQTREVSDPFLFVCCFAALLTRHESLWTVSSPFFGGLCLSLFFFLPLWSKTTECFVIFFSLTLLVKWAFFFSPKTTLKKKKKEEKTIFFFHHVVYVDLFLGTTSILKNIHFQAFFFASVLKKYNNVLFFVDFPQWRLKTFYFSSVGEKKNNFL